MLRFLRIARLAVIDSVEVEFGPGLNVLTGETGAGKSILVGAVSLLLGGRASAELVRTGEDVATVEAIIETPNGSELLVRREVTAQGRSRSFVNGALVTAAALKGATAGLIELHGQHEHQTLLDPASHLNVLDAFARVDGLAADVRQLFDLYEAGSGALEDARRAARERDARLELVTFQLNELEKARPLPGEDESLHAARQLLASAERLERLCSESYSALYERDGSILAELGGVWKRVGELAGLDPQFHPYLDARDGIKSQLEDLAMFLRRYADRIDASPARLQQTEERLALVERLKRKYGPAMTDVLARLQALRQEHSELELSEERIAQLEAAREESRNRYVAAANELSRLRRAASTRLSSALELELAELAMDQTRFEVRFEEPALPEERWARSGIDAPEFYVSPNPGEDLRPLARIASGGELSRIMLALKMLTLRPEGDDTGHPTSLVFDEVDAGIGGRVADVVGRKLASLGSGVQVLCITHLPQIAAYANAHVRISKTVEQDRTKTIVSVLSAHERVEELGRMLGGGSLSDQIRASARELLTRRAVESSGGESKPKGESESAKAKARRPRSVSAAGHERRSRS
jgi:DNA repair protein RecN (Recombination protein N)